jgi:hypothetical protein
VRAPASIVIAALLVGGCGLGEAGMPLPRQQAGQTFPGDRQDLHGVFAVSDFGCLNIVLDGETFMVIWPAGSDYAELGERPNGVRLPDGQVIVDGDAVLGTGAFTPTAPLLADRDTSLAHAIRGCAPDASELVVLDAVRRGS